MSYTALYRKYRPVTFDEVSGQEHVVTTLRNQISGGRIGHAYLFCGTRGTGKTSVAKVFAKAVNCEHPVNGNPCNDCACCRAIAEGNSLNVIEIDAASNNGVDNIRQIRDEVSYSPSEGRYKVYIIDEVHMLSAGAFNALLKTLEEPPAYVIFILATTEVHKVPITIVSRCQRYDFRRISQEEISNRLKELFEKEGIDAEEKAIRYIARKGDGALRDALSLADQCVSFYLGQTLTYERVLEVLGAVDTQELGILFRRVIASDVAGIFRQLEELIFGGKDISQLTADFTEYLRNLLVIKTLNSPEDAASLLDASGENLQLMLEEASLADEEMLIRDIRIFSELSVQLRFAVNRRILLEVALVKLCHPQMEQDIESLSQRIRVLEQMLENGVTVQKTRPEAAGIPAAVSAEPEQRVVYQKAAPAEIAQVKEQWGVILGGLPSGIFKRTIAKAALRFDASGAEEDVLFLLSDDITAGACAADQENIRQLEDIIEGMIGKRIRIRIMEEKQEDTYAGRLRPVEIMEQARTGIHHMIETVSDEEQE